MQSSTHTQGARHLADGLVEPVPATYLEKLDITPSLAQFQCHAVGSRRE